MFICCVSFSQVKYGVKFGLNESVYRFYEYKFEKFKSGFNGGFIFQIPMHKNFFIQTEILYSEKGYKQEGDFPFTTYLDYITLPLLFGVKVKDKLSFAGGAEFNKLLSEEYKLTTGGAYRDSHKKFDAGFTIGVAFKFTKKFGVDARYFYGLVNGYETYVTDQYGNITETKYVGNNRVYQFNIFYLISK